MLNVLLMLGEPNPDVSFYFQYIVYTVDQKNKVKQKSQDLDPAQQGKSLSELGIETPTLSSKPLRHADTRGVINWLDAVMSFSPSLKRCSQLQVYMKLCESSRPTLPAAVPDGNNIKQPVFTIIFNFLYINKPLF